MALLTGSQTAKQKKDVRERIAAGEVQVVIGTHALLSESTRFDNLGLVITDEQHRFGVGQRSRLSAKGEAPHLLVMSATPIPRTLAPLSGRRWRRDISASWSARRWKKTRS